MSAQTDLPSRILGHWGKGERGPTLILLAAIHGNEPSGKQAIERIAVHLNKKSIPLNGEIVALLGNLAALKLKQRFIVKDLNRVWTEPRVASLRAQPKHLLDNEDIQQLELLEVLEQFTDRREAPCYFIDLHTSSADGVPFLTIGDTLRNRKFASHFELPLILGLEEQVDGALLEFMNNRGHITLGIEAGQHDAKSSIDYHESMLWLCFKEAGVIAERDIPNYEMHQKRLKAIAESVPEVIEVRHRHAITPESGFKMLPGFRNFDPVEKGRPIARDHQGIIRAPEEGVILLPLYQGLGDDGFFTAREVKAYWLKVSEWLRKLRLDRYLPMLPGVEETGRGTLRVDTRIARFWPLELFHLLGYRKLREVDCELVVSRRRFDFESPSSEQWI